MSDFFCGGCGGDGGGGGGGGGGGVVDCSMKPCSTWRKFSLNK